MTTLDGSQSDRSMEQADDYDVMGVINALERICELESKLRQAVQQTHPLTTTLDWDFNAADREREALLAISEQVEYLEDKLREYRFVNPNSDQRSMLLSQMDSVRRELLEVIEINYSRITFGKEVVRDLLNFAVAGDETPRQLGSPSDKGTTPTPKGKAQKPSPTQQPAATLVGMVSPGNTQGSSFNNELWESEAPSAKDAPRPRRYAPAYTKSLQISDEDIYGPDPAAAKAGTGSIFGTGGGGAGGGSISTSSREGGGTYRSTSSAPPPQPASTVNASGNFGGVVRIRDMLAKAEQGLSAVAEAQEQRRSLPPRIFGNGTTGTTGGGGGGDDWETVADELTPRGDKEESVIDDGSYWGGAATSERGGGNGGGGGGGSPAPSSGGWAITAEPSLRGTRALPPASPSSLFDATSDPNNTTYTGLPGLVGKLAGLAFVLGSIAAATMAATGVLSTPGGEKKKGRGAGVGADLPPWKDASTNSGRRSSSSTSTTTSQQRRRSAGGSAGGSNSNRTRAQRSSGRSSPSGQAPVMHVHQPPSSGSFPSNPPPDVTVAMG